MTEDIQKLIDSLEEFKAYLPKAIEETNKLFEEIDMALNIIRHQIKDNGEQSQ